MIPNTGGVVLMSHLVHDSELVAVSATGHVLGTFSIDLVGTESSVSRSGKIAVEVYGPFAHYALVVLNFVEPGEVFVPDLVVTLPWGVSIEAKEFFPNGDLAIALKSRAAWAGATSSFSAFGKTFDAPDPEDHWLVRVDPSGNASWVREINAKVPASANPYLQVLGLGTTDDDRLLVYTGFWGDLDWGAQHYSQSLPVPVVLGVDSAGEPNFAVQPSEPTLYFEADFSVFPNGGFALVGRTHCNGTEVEMFDRNGLLTQTRMFNPIICPPDRWVPASDIGPLLDSGFRSFGPAPFQFVGHDTPKATARGLYVFGGFRGKASLKDGPVSSIDQVDGFLMKLNP
jgi:hypothetical protein